MCPLGANLVVTQPLQAGPQRWSCAQLPGNRAEGLDGLVLHSLSVDFVIDVGRVLGDHHPSHRIDVNELPVYTDGHELAFLTLGNPELICVAQCRDALEQLTARLQVGGSRGHRVLYPLRRKQLLALQVATLIQV